METRNVALVGYMGAGKTGFGRSLAAEFSRRFIDLDEVIEKMEGSSVPGIMERNGELYFRRIERRAMEKVAGEIGKGEIILACGGGTPCYFDNMDYLNEHFLTIYLELPVAVLAERLRKEKENRPLISHLGDEDIEEFVGKHLFERAPYYRQAHITWKATGEVGELVEKVKNYRN